MTAFDIRLPIWLFLLIREGKQEKTGTLFYPGYHELAYLHPRRFTPDRGVLAEAGISEGERYFVLRFNAFKAHHDKEPADWTRAEMDWSGCCNLTGG